MDALVGTGWWDTGKSFLRNYHLRSISKPHSLPNIDTGMTTIMSANELHTIALLARAPTPGRSKTRLIPALGADGACEFAKAALTDLLHLMVEISSCRRILFYTPAESKADLQSLLNEEGLASSWQLECQSDTPDLGGRLSGALELIQRNRKSADSSIAPRPTVTFMGMDCFDLTPEKVQNSMRVVSQSSGKAHMHPALDGGYVVLTVPLQCNANTIFSEIAWSTNQTGEMQMRRLETAGLTCDLGEKLPDVDEPVDLETLWERHSSISDFPSTMRYLRSIMPDLLKK